MNSIARAWLASAALAVSAAAAGQNAELTGECRNRHQDVGLPKYRGDDPPSHTFVCHARFLLSHNNDTKIPDWVIEELTPARFVGPGNRDLSNFKPDPVLLNAGVPFAVDLNYAGAGFDRGHMAPAADMKESQPIMDESHLLSNIAPQVGIGFNRHIWAELEEAVRDWTLHRLRLIVMTGPIYDDTDRVMKNTTIPVPPRFYKIVYEPDRHRAIAFILPNKKIKGRDLARFIVTIHDVEEATGLDFLSELPNRTEGRVERNLATMWTR